MLNPSPAINLPSMLHVADVASQAEVTRATVRYYSRIGLLSPDRDPENSYRCFSATDVRRVVFIRRAQALGLTIGDIKSILETVDRGRMPCRQVKSLVRRRLVSIRAQIDDLQATEAYIAKTLKSWNDIGDQIRRSGELCPLIERAGLMGSGDS